MSYQVQTELFEGPLDLLLTLIEKDKLDITELSLARICAQYHAYVKLLQEMDLDVESSYVVVLAELLEIKSRLLLPEEPDLPAFDDAYLADAPPDDPLVIKLREYRRVKDAAHKLAEREKEALSSFGRPSHVRPVDDAKDLSEVSLVDLLDALKGLLSTQDRVVPMLKMRRIPLSVPQRMLQIWGRVEGRGEPVSFVDLLSEDSTRAEVIVTFLAILELARMQRIEMRQSGALGVIYLRSHPAASGPLVLSEAAGPEGDVENVDAPDPGSEERE